MSTPGNNASEHLDSDRLFTRKQNYFYIISGVETLVCVIGNTLFLFVMTRSKKTSSSNMYLIMSSLSVADTFGGLALSWSIIKDFLVYDYGTQYELCRCEILVGSTYLNINLYHLLLMTGDRYMALAVPHR